MFKWIGLFIGIIVGRFWGGLIGWLIGSLLDRLFAPKVKIYTHRYQRSDFMESMLILTAAVLKADGHVERSEFAYVRDYLVRSLGPQQAQDAMNRLTEILGESYNIESVCAELRENSTIHERLLIIQFLFGVATADGELHQSEVAVIELIAQWSGVSRSDYESIKAMFTYGFTGTPAVPETPVAAEVTAEVTAEEAEVAAAIGRTRSTATTRFSKSRPTQATMR